MHHPFLDLDFKDTPDFFYKVLKVSQQNFENSWGFPAAGSRPLPTASRGMNDIGRRVRGGPTTPLRAGGKNQPVF